MAITHDAKTDSEISKRPVVVKPHSSFEPVWYVGLSVEHTSFNLVDCG